MLGFLLFVGSGAFAAAHGPGTPNPSLTIKVYDFARVPPQAMARAQGVTTYLINMAGVETVWLNCHLPNDGVEGDAACRKHGAGQVSVRILPRAMSEALAVPGHVFGVAAIPTGKQRGSQVYVFHHRVQELATQMREVDGSVLLGHVVAHEVGHLLLGSGSHSPGGLMAADWFKRDLRKLAQGGLLFTDDHRRRIHADVAARLGEELSAARGR